MKKGLIGHNPTDRVTAPRPKHKEMRPLTPDEVGVLLETSRPDRLHPLFVLLVTTGLRIGEAAALRWTDVDWTDRRHTRHPSDRPSRHGQGARVW